jgi:hypothetical protein
MLTTLAGNGCFGTRQLFLDRGIATTQLFVSVCADELICADMNERYAMALRN